MFKFAAYNLKKYFTYVQDAIKSINDIILDDQGHILTWNSTLQKLEGYSDEEIIGQSFRLFYPFQERQLNVPEKLLIDAKRKGSSRQFGQFLKKDGGTYWGVLRLTAIKKGDNNVLGYVAQWHLVK